MGCETGAVNQGDLIAAYLDHFATAAFAAPMIELEQMADAIWATYLSRDTVYVFGNGACAALSAHMATDLSKGTAVGLGMPPQQATAPRIRVVSLADNTALLTALGNDIGYEYVFVEQLRGLLRPGDAVLGLSGSGGSPNVLRALEYARTVRARRLGLTGRMASATELVSRCEIAVQAPSSMMEQIEDWHVIYNHVLTVLLRARLRAHMAAAHAAPR
ncbi:MAG: SIS domain-containing protein [Actinophytocola sp.]|uniref:D-sedoheptulose-7-phosphate isomerase n=1 Tax=Actinophytocola sp. TaxID=1872138 RepID=UPI003C767852